MTANGVYEQLTTINNDVPFARYCGITVSTLHEAGATATLPREPSLLNHVHTQHAGALATPAESASGACMLGLVGERFDSTTPLVRGATINYLRPAEGPIIASIEMKERDGLSTKSSSTSDFYEELLVNPTIVGIARRRGELDCGGLRHVVVGYGHFNQVVVPTPDGHVSIAVELGVDPQSIVVDVAGLVERFSREPTSPPGPRPG